MINFDLPSYTPIQIAAELANDQVRPLEWEVPTDQVSQFKIVLPDLEDIINNVLNPIRDNPQSLTCETGSPVYSFENSGGGRRYEFKFKCSGYTLDTRIIQSLLANRAGLSSITLIRDLPPIIDPIQGFAITDSSIDQFTLYVDGTTPDGATVTTSVTLTTTELLVIFDASIVSTDPNQPLPSSPVAPSTESLPPTTTSPQTTEQFPPQPLQPTQPLPDAPAACASNPVNLDPESVDQADSLRCQFDENGDLVIKFGPYTKLSDLKEACANTSDPKACQSILEFSKKDGAATTLTVVTAPGQETIVMSDDLFFPKSLPLDEIISAINSAPAKSKLSVIQSMLKLYREDPIGSIFITMASLLGIIFPVTLFFENKKQLREQEERRAIRLAREEETKRQAEKKAREEEFMIRFDRKISKLQNSVGELDTKLKNLSKDQSNFAAAASRNHSELKGEMQKGFNKVWAGYEAMSGMLFKLYQLLRDLELKSGDTFITVQYSSDEGNANSQRGEVVDGEVREVPEEPYGYLGASNDYQDDE